MTFSTLSYPTVDYNALLESVVASIPQITEECEKLDFTAADNRDETITFSLDDLRISEIARNKCGITSKEIVENADLGFLKGNITATFTGIQSPAGNHYGVLLSQTGDTYGGIIVDFTARQFDPESVFPLVMDCWEWQRWTESYLGRVGNWYHTYEW
jgi:hypothetical protein